MVELWGCFNAIACLPLASEEDNGTFWIQFSDVLRYFVLLYVARLRRGWFELHLKSHFPLLSPEGSYYFEEISTNAEKNEIEINLLQNSQR